MKPIGRAVGAILPRPAAVALSFAMAFTAIGACGTAADEASGDPDSTADGADGDGERAITVVTPFPSAIAFANLYVAEAHGYFQDEGLDLTIEVVNGGSATVQAVAAGQADIGVTGPAPILQGAATGRDVVAFTTDYYDSVYSLITIPETGIQSIDDLEGQTVGISDFSGGEVPIVEATLQDSGMSRDTDYDLIAIGSGGSAASALTNGDVAAFGTSYVEVAIMEASGLSVTDLTPSDAVETTGQHYYATRETLDNQSDSIVGPFTAALARGTDWMFANPDETVELLCGSDPVFVDECQDDELERRIFEKVIELMTPPSGADGQFGFTPIDALSNFAGTLTELGVLEGDVDANDVFTNRIVEGTGGGES